jgi:hypothetical protein
VEDQTHVGKVEKMTTVRCISWIVLLACWTTALGCKTSQKGGVEGRTQPFNVKSTFAAQGSVAARDLMPMQPGQQRFAEWVVEKSSASHSEDVVFTIEPSSEFHAQWSRAEGESRKEFFSIDAGGNLLLHAVIVYGDKAISQFSPPLVVAYADMPAGVELRSESKMRVVDLNNRLKQREIGTAIRTVRYIDDQVIQTNLTEHHAKRLEVHFTADLKLAKADEHSTMWVVPGTGIIASENREDIRVLGVAGKSTHRILTLVDSTPAPPSEVVTSMPQ